MIFLCSFLQCYILHSKHSIYTLRYYFTPHSLNKSSILKVYLFQASKVMHPKMLVILKFQTTLQGYQLKVPKEMAADDPSTQRIRFIMKRSTKMTLGRESHKKTISFQENATNIFDANVGIFLWLEGYNKLQDHTLEEY